MYFGDYVRETTTSTGTGNLTLAGAVAQHQSVSSVVGVGDPFEYSLLDANGTARETGIGTLLTSTTMSRDTILASTNSGAAISLSTGTHTLLASPSAEHFNKRQVFGDCFLDFVQSGLVVPTTSGMLSGSISAGVAYIVGQRVVKGIQTRTYTVSKDTYVDLSNKGVLTYVEVANGGTAPAITANSMRLGKVVTGSSTITSGTDLRNRVYQAACSLVGNAGNGFSQSLPNATTVAISFNNATYENTNNNGMHSATTNASRITVAVAGFYQAAGYMQVGPVSGATWYAYVLLRVNGTQAGGSYVQATGSTYPLGSAVGPARWMNVGDYVELAVSANDSGSSPSPCIEAGLSLIRVG